MQIKQSNIRFIEPHFTIVHIAYDKKKGNYHGLLTCNALLSVLHFHRMMVLNIRYD